MFASSLSPPVTPRHRSAEAAGEPLMLPRYHDSDPSRKRRPWLSRSRVIMGAAILSLGVWTLIAFTPSSSRSLLGRPIKIVTPVIESDTITAVNATLLAPEDGITKWTVSIPPGITAPLRPSVYRGICKSVHEVSQRARGHDGEHVGHHDYNWVDELFVDPADATPVPMEREVCETSLTYLLESSHAGFGLALMGLWSAYGLARKEGRAFFLDDRNWAWGRYSTYFTPPNTPTCAPPPPHWLLPCPHTAKHLVVAASTNSYTFGHAFMEAFEDPSKMGVLRQHSIFTLVRQGYEELFRLGIRSDDLGAVEARKKVFVGGDVTALQVRRGDGKSVGWGWRETGGAVPLEVLAGVARNVSAVGHGGRGKAGMGVGTVVMGSDDSTVYGDVETARFLPAQLGGELRDGRVREVGGFTEEWFWEAGMVERVYAGREYLRDLKILGELAGRGNGKVVCSGGCTTCRLLAVVMGWERAVVGEGWHNVDGEFEWSGVPW